jgi:peroxiredoxin
MILFALAAALCSAPQLHAAAWQPAEGKSLIGTRAPQWRGIQWLQGGPLSLAALHGKVVLLRFWLVDCPFCAATAPALKELSEHYGDRGLVVVGIHHPKAEELQDPAVVAKAAHAFGFTFPIGIDNEWQTIRAYGVGTTFQRFTSVSFLIDREGVIRFVHDGGEFHQGGGPKHAQCNAAYEALKEAIEEALGDSRSARSLHHRSSAAALFLATPALRFGALSLAADGGFLIEGALLHLFEHAFLGEFALEHTHRLIQ